MQYTLEFSVDTFPFWSGAKETVNAVRKANKMDELQLLIEENFSNQIPSQTVINDFVWFNSDFIFSQLGIEP